MADTIARHKKKQITGFNLNGHLTSDGGTPVVERDGRAVARPR